MASTYPRAGAGKRQWRTAAPYPVDTTTRSSPIVEIVPDLDNTRSSLHAVAENLLAGPQFRQSGTIRLRALTGGFGTVADPDVRVVGTTLRYAGRSLPLTGTTIGALAAAAGLRPGAPTNYHDGSGATAGTAVDVDPEAAALLADCYAWGDTALRRLEPTTTPVLWPEHFDIGVTIDEVNYGVSPGDSYHGEPYAYVGPWNPRTGDFWNAPFGAARPLADLGTGPDPIHAFFVEGREHAERD